MPGMHWYPIVWVAIFVLITPSALCDDVGYVFKENGGHFLANATISRYDPSEIVSSTTAGSGTPCSSSNTLGWLQNTFDQRVEPDQVHNDAVDLVQSEGSCTIDQICYLYDYLTKSWRYVADPRCKDYFQYANETLQHGKKSKPTCAGAGDCDDFAILMASMVESIGGTTRIILAYGPLGGHAYAEVYLGDISKDKSIAQIVDWLKIRYNRKEIATHQNTTTGDVWLNLDWGENIHQAAYPGGPLFSATEHKPIYIKKDVAKTRLSPSPMALFTHPAEANGGGPVTFDASASGDVDDIAEYNWNFGDNTSGKGKTMDHLYSRGGRFLITLRVMDGQGLQNSTTSFILVNNPPIARFNYSPSEPQVGDTIEFDASGSQSRDGKIINYEWKVGNRKFEGPDLVEITQTIPRSGESPVNLTVTNDKGAKNTTSRMIMVKEPIPTAHFTYTPTESNVGDEVIFDASGSFDKYGKIVSYEWDFDDLSPPQSTPKPKIKHAFTEKGRFNVTLAITNDKSIQNQSIIPVVVGANTNQKPTLMSLSSEPQGSAEAGTTVVWTAQASDPENDPLSYRFMLNSAEVQPFGPEKTWSWNTANAKAGINKIEVQVKDDNHGDEYNNKVAEITIKGPENKTHEVLPLGETTPMNATRTSTNVSASPLPNYNARSPMRGIWAVTGIKQEQIIMALNQNGNDLFGAAKYEPENSVPWNAAVAGSVSNDQVHMVITPQSVSGANSITLDAIYRNDAISGEFFEVSMGNIINRGEFSATLVNPDPSEYAPAEVTITTAHQTATQQSVTVSGRKNPVNVHDYADKIGPGGNLTGVPIGMG